MCQSQVHRCTKPHELCWLGLGLCITLEIWLTPLYWTISKTDWTHMAHTSPTYTLGSQATKRCVLMSEGTPQKRSPYLHHWANGLACKCRTLIPSNALGRDQLPPPLWGVFKHSQEIHIVGKNMQGFQNLFCVKISLPFKVIFPRISWKIFTWTWEPVEFGIINFVTMHLLILVLIALNIVSLGLLELVNSITCR